MDPHQAPYILGTVWEHGPICVSKNFKFFN